MFVDSNAVDYHAYKYCAERSGDFVPNEDEASVLAFRKIEFIISEILADMGIAKGTLVTWLINLFLASAMLWMRMFFHYMGQWVLLKCLDCPVTEVGISWNKITLKYGFWNVT